MRPFSQSYWANNPQEAVQMAQADTPRAHWIEGPTVSETSEEQRMRSIGAPELPGLEIRPNRKKPARK